MNAAELYGLNTRNCINGMMVVDMTSTFVSWVTSRVFGCHRLDGQTFEFLIQRTSRQNDYKGIGDLMNDPNPSQLHMTIHMENTLKELLKNRLEIQEEMNSKVLMDFYGASESFEADLKTIEPM